MAGEGLAGAGFCAKAEPSTSKKVRRCFIDL
jgi:hypothetical protein